MKRNAKEWWCYLVRSYLVNATEEQVERVATRAAEPHPERPGLNVGVYHAAWELRRVGNYPCVPLPRRREQKEVNARGSEGLDFPVRPCDFSGEQTRGNLD